MDTGCKEELVIEVSDAEMLGLVEKERKIVLVADESGQEVIVYDPVTLVIPFANGDKVSTLVTPVAFSTLVARANGARASITQLLGLPVLQRMSLKIDCRSRTLIRRISRV